MRASIIYFSHDMCAAYAIFKSYFGRTCLKSFQKNKTYFFFRFLKRLRRGVHIHIVNIPILG